MFSNNSGKNNSENTEKVSNEETLKLDTGIKYKCINQNKIGYIIFNSETEFEMKLADIDTEYTVISGIYSINKNIITLIVNYDSNYVFAPLDELDSSFEEYSINITIINDEELNYTTDADYTYIFKLGTNTEKTEQITNNELLNQIYTKYPEYKEKENFICYDNDNCWLLSDQGEKIYFSDMVSFENALEESNNNMKNKSNQNTNNTEENFIRIPDLTGLTEQEAISKIKALNVPYEIVYMEDLSNKEGIVIDQTTHSKILTNSQGKIVAAYALRILYNGETLAVVVNKYKERSINFNVHIVCLIKQYLEICKTKGITPTTNQFTFKLKINDKIIYTETLLRSTIEEKIRKNLTGSLSEDMLCSEDLLNPAVIDTFLIYGDCGILQETSYTGYGVFKFTMTVNEIIVRDDSCNFYNSIDGIDFVKSNNNNLKGRTIYYNDDYYFPKPTLVIRSYTHGGQG